MTRTITLPITVVFQELPGHDSDGLPAIEAGVVYTHRLNIDLGETEARRIITTARRHLRDPDITAVELPALDTHGRRRTIRCTVHEIPNPAIDHTDRILARIHPREAATC